MADEQKGAKIGKRFTRWVRERFWPEAWSQLRRCARIFYFAGREFRRDNCVIRAAALSFVMLLSLVPATFVFFIVVNFLGAFKTYGQGLIMDISNRVLPGDQFNTAREWINSRTGDLISQASGDIAGISFNILSFGAMIVTAGLLLTAVEKSINDIWGVRVRRGVLKRLANVWLIITMGPVLVFFSYYFGLRATAALPQTIWFYNVFLFLLPYFFSVLAFYLIFQFVPYTAVRSNAALAGAIFSGIVWEFSKVPFTAYVSNVIDPTAVYGSLGVIPFFLLWVYLTWVIALFGTEISYCKQNYDVISSAHRHDEHFISLYKSYFTIRILGEAAASFNSGQGPIKVNRVARKLSMPVDLCQELAENLQKKGLLSHPGPDRRRFQLARPSDKITLRDVLDRVSTSRLEVPPHADTPADRKIEKLFSEINQHRENILSSVMLADLLSSEAPPLCGGVK